MSLSQSEARRRVVVVAAEMLARHGLSATSIRQMVKQAEAPFGSTYHYFPGGKQQVVLEAIKEAGTRVGRVLEHHLQAGPAAGVQGFLAIWRDTLIRSNFNTGCPVMAVAIEDPVDGADEEILSAAEQVFSRWQNQLGASLLASGHDAASASGLATLIVAAVEGGIALCRASRRIEPFDRIAEQLTGLLEQALPGVGDKS